MDERVIKVNIPHEDRTDGLPNYPYNFLPHTPPPDMRFRLVPRNDRIRHLPFRGHDEDSGKLPGILESL